MPNKQNENNGVEQKQLPLTNYLICESTSGDYCALTTDPEPALLDVFNELMV